MNKYLKIVLLALVMALTVSLFGCADLESLLLGGDPYSITDIDMIQTGVNEYRIEFTANCGKDDVKVYVTEGFRLSDKAEPKQVEKTADGKNVRFSLTQTYNLGEDYYLWLVYGDKMAKTTLSIPSMFPSLKVNEDGSATFNFNYTYGTAWGSFCDANGKSVYKSKSPVFDETATLIAENISITTENVQISAADFDATCYYFAVSSAKEGAVRTISRPVMVYDDFIGQITGISAKLTEDLKLQVSVQLPEKLDGANVTDALGLLIKTAQADEVYISGCTYADGVATMQIDLSQLIFSDLWYDVLITWRGAVVMDVPQFFNGAPIYSSSSVNGEGVTYKLTGWKDGSAPAMSEMLKVYFEYGTLDAASIFQSYQVSFTTDPVPAVNVTVVLKDGQRAPTLAITGGSKDKIDWVKGTKNEDGSYTYTLPVKDALTEAGKWYDLRFFSGDIVYEIMKNDCITDDIYNGKYTDEAGSRLYEFREWNGMLKIQFSNVSE